MGSRVTRAVSIWLVVIAGYLAFTLGFAAQTAFGATVINGQCKVHLGKLVRRTSVGSQFGFRIGPRDGHTGGDFRCHGQHRISTKGGSLTGWLSFNLSDWRYHGVVTFVKTGIELTGACAGFATGLIGEIPSGGLDTAITGAAGLGCTDGVHTLWVQVPSSPDNSRVLLLK